MKAVDPNELVAIWPKRQREWARALGRIRLGVEPVGLQVEKLRRVTQVLSLVAGGIGLALFALFCAFRSPGTGAIVAGVLMGPIILSAWLGFWRLEKKAAQYLCEMAEVERLRTSS